MKDVLITGASAGIGFETARRMASSGWRVFALSRNKSKLEQLCFSTRGCDGLVVPVVFDVTNTDYAVLEEVLAAKGCQHLSAVLQNAGMLINKPFEELELSDWRSVYEVNVFGVAMLTRVLLTRMGGEEPTHLVMSGSIGGLGTTAKFAGLSAYSSSKGALAIMAECLAEEFRGRNIFVNCLAFGSVQTEMLNQAFPGYRAPVGPVEMGDFVAGFCDWGWKYFNGKLVPVSLTNP